MPFIAVAVSVLLGGCYQRIDQTDIEYANRICESNGSKVLEIEAMSVGTEYVRCTNRKIFKIVP